MVFAVLAGCASDAPTKAGHEPVKQSQVTQTMKNVGTGRVEAVRGVVMDDAKRSSRAPVGTSVSGGSLSQTMTSMLSLQREGVEVVVHLDDGADMTVVQAADVVFRPGDRVRVMQSHDGSTRVTY